MRTAGSLELVECRRLIAIRLLDNGLAAEDVAEALEVSLRSVQRWRQAVEAGGEEALRPAEVSGRPPKLCRRQEAAVLAWLEKDARDFGFDTQLWTAARVGQVIRSRFGVRFHERYLQQWLCYRRITLQVPEPVSRERDPAAIARWRVHDWPRIKKSPVAPVRQWRSSMKPAC